MKALLKYILPNPDNPRVIKDYIFKKEYKGKAKEKYAECYNLLKLRTV